MLDDAFEALKKYDWGTDRAPLNPIVDAVTSAHGNAEARKALETRLLAALASDISRDAKDYICRLLTIVGSGIPCSQDSSYPSRRASGRPTRKWKPCSGSIATSAYSS